MSWRRREKLGSQRVQRRRHQMTKSASTTAATAIRPASKAQAVTHPGVG